MNKYHNESYLPNQLLINFFKQNNTKEEFSILEIGCNEGYNLKAVHDLYPEAKCFGIDIAQEALTTAKEKFPEGSFYCANVEELNGNELFQLAEQFDYIFLPDVLEHLTFPTKVMKHVYNMLKPDGKVFANIPNIMHYSVLYDLIVNGRFTYTDTGLLDYDHKHFFTLREANEMFQQTGFKKIKSTAIFLNSPVKEDFIQFLLSAKDSVCDEIEFKTFCFLSMLEKDNNND